MRVKPWITFVPIVGDLLQVQEVCSHGNIVDFIRVTDLDFHALAQRGKHLGENYLFVPDGLVAALLNRRFPLKNTRQSSETWNNSFYLLMWKYAGKPLFNLLPSKLHLDIRINQVLIFSYKGLFDVGHDAGVHSGEPLSPVDLQIVASPLSLCRHAVWQQEIPGRGKNGDDKITKSVMTGMKPCIPSKRWLMKYLSGTPLSRLRQFH